MYKRTSKKKYKNFVNHRFGGIGPIATLRFECEGRCKIKIHWYDPGTLFGFKGNTKKKTGRRGVLGLQD